MTALVAEVVEEIHEVDPCVGLRAQPCGKPATHIMLLKCCGWVDLLCTAHAEWAVAWLKSMEDTLDTLDCVMCGANVACVRWQDMLEMRLR